MGGNSTRGRFIPDCDCTKSRRLSVEDHSAIYACVNFRRSSCSAGKVWVVCKGRRGGGLVDLRLRIRVTLSHVCLVALEVARWYLYEPEPVVNGEEASVEG